jgi:hypothetical protein
MPSESISLRSPASDTAYQRLLRAGVEPPAATAVIVGVGWLGAAIFRLAAFTFSHIVVIDHDVCTPATVLGGVSEARDVGQPKVVAAARWARRRGAARVTPVALAVQTLGAGFWRHVAGRDKARAERSRRRPASRSTEAAPAPNAGGRARPALVWCALDNAFAVAAAARAGRLVGMPVVTTNIEGARGLLRVYPPAPQAACYHCLGVGMTRRGRACLDPLASRISSPTIAAPAVAESLAALAFRQGIAAASAAEAAYEIRMGYADSAPLPAVTLSRLRPSAQCTQWHAAGDSPRVVRLTAPTTAVTLADVREAATRDPNARVSLDGGRLVSRLECARRCGAAPLEVLRLGCTLTSADLCPHCAGEMVPTRHAPARWTGRESAVRGVTLADLGSPLWPVLRVQDSAGISEVEVTGDRGRVLPGGVR